MSDQNELIELNRDLKARNSELSRDLGLAQREIKVWQDAAGELAPLRDECEDLKGVVKDLRRQVEANARAAADADLSASEIQKRADAFVAIREALAVK